jgi:YidC/Oxa1 family membrane protein insertase
MWLLGLLKTISLGSWGLAIILLTVVVKVCLHPINRKSQGSMQRFQKKLQKVKPQMDEIKAKYAQNRIKMNQELQKVFKEHGINPGQQMAGCLILFLQLPIWLGLYYSLQYAIGLRQASFLYVSDLTRPDHLFSFGTNVPFLGMYFNLLPVLYVILTVVNQQLQPKPDDPQMRAQFRMMSFMLVFFGFIFYSFPAGFMFYFMTSSALGILESKIIKAELAREGDLASPALSASGAPSASSTYYPSRPKKPEEDSGRKKKGR